MFNRLEQLAIRELIELLPRLKAQYEAPKPAPVANYGDVFKNLIEKHKKDPADAAKDASSGSS